MGPSLLEEYTNVKSMTILYTKTYKRLVAIYSFVSKGIVKKKEIHISHLFWAADMCSVST